MVVLLGGFVLGVRVDGGRLHVAEIFVKGSFHLLGGGLLLVMREFSSLHSDVGFLDSNRGTIPSSRMILLAVSHLLLLSIRGSAL